MIGIDGFGLSAPAGEIFDHFGITGPKVAATVTADDEPSPTVDGKSDSTTRSNPVGGLAALATCKIN